MFRSFAAIGDSFTEGVGDERDDGSVRGWADLVALAMAAACPEPFRYANLAVRGRKLGPVVAEQLEPAIALGADLLGINGGGNDLLRPRVSIEWVANTLDDAVTRAHESGAHVLLTSGANPTGLMPLGSMLKTRGDRLEAALLARLPRDGVTFVNNWADEGLADSRYWSADHMHLGVHGHARVAANVLQAFDIPVPEEWGVAEVAAAAAGEPLRRTAAYYRDYVMPWIGRRLTGRSSGDGRSAKLPTLTPVTDPRPRLLEGFRTAS